MSKQKNIQKKLEQFNVPDGYFKQSQTKILNKIEWEEEMAAFPTLSKLKESVGFITPSNYFVNREITLELLAYEKLSSIRNYSGFQIPADYLKNSELVLNQLLTQEANSYSNLETAHLKQNNFVTPEAYFEKNAKQLEQLLQQDKPAKIISISFSKFAFAAAAILLISLGFWYFQNLEKPVNNNDCNTLACIEKRELLKSKQLENIDDEDLYELVNPSALEQDLNQSKTQDNKPNDSLTQEILSDEFLDNL